MAEELALDDEVLVPVPTNMDELDKLLKRKQLIKPKLDDAKSKVAAIKSNAQSLEVTIVQPLIKLDGAIDVAIESYLHSHRSWILRKFGKTITLPHGVVKWFIRHSFDLPKDETAVVAALLKRRGGKKYLDVSYRVNETALSQAPRSLLARLSRLGVWSGRYEHLNITVAGQKTPVKLSRRRYYGPLNQRKKK
jgi:phage host-nuclease inhibitor protein Gam